MKLNLSFLNWLGFAVILAVFTLCFYVTHTFDSRDHEEVVTSLKDLRQIRASIIEDSLRIRTGLQLSYDSIAGFADSAKFAADRLRRKFEKMSLPNSRELSEALKRYDSQFAVDIEQIEKYKSANSVVRNSLRYLPVAFEETKLEVIGTPSHGLAGRIYEKTLLYSVQPGDDLRNVIAADVRSLEAELRARKNTRKTKNFLSHVLLILEYQLRIDQELLAFTGTRSYQAVNDLFRVYSEGYSRALSLKSRYEGAMYLLFVIVLGYLALVVTKLSGTFVALKSSNAELATKVIEIAELHALAENKVSIRTEERNHLQQSLKSLERVLGVIGHELRTPLACLRALADFLLICEDRHSDEFNEFLEAVPEQVVRMSQDVNDLLEVARLNSGAAKWNWGELDVAEVVNAALNTLRPCVDAEAIKLYSTVIPGSLKMKGDGAALRRLLTNLLNNSSKYTSQGWIAISATGDSENNTVEFVISDSGDGMTPEVGEQLGVAFALNEGMIGESHVKGSGLGLAICRGIVAAHGGSIRVESALGCGTSVYVSLSGDLESPARSDGSVEVTFRERRMSDSEFIRIRESSLLRMAALPAA